MTHKLLAWIFISTIYFHYTIPLVQANTQCDTIKVGGGNWLDIKEINNLKGSAAGSSVSLLYKLPEFIRVKITFEPVTPFARQLYQLKEGQLDVVAGVYPTKERQQHYIFSDNYYYEKLFVFAKPEKINQLNNIAQLKNAVGAIIRGASYGAELDELYKDQSKSVEANDQTQRLELLLHDRVDYFIGAITSVGDSHDMKNIAISEKPIYRQGVALAFSPKSACKQFLPKINEFIKMHFISE